MITLTEIAEVKMKSVLTSEINAGREVTGVRFGVSGGGCSGYVYMSTLDNQKEDDIVQDINGLKIYMSPESAPLLSGINVDYLDSLEASGFVITNPNAKSTCGCGKSFDASVETDQNENSDS